MTNQQETSLAWLAGILDGEGWIGFNVRARHKTERGREKKSILPWVSVSNTSIEIIQRCQDVCTMFGIACNFTKANVRTKANNLIFIWSIAGAKRVEQLLPLVIPYLALKGERAKAVLAFIRSRRVTGYQKTYTAQELSLVQSTRKGSSETTREAPTTIQ